MIVLVFIYMLWLLFSAVCVFKKILVTDQFNIRLHFWLNFGLDILKINIKATKRLGLGKTKNI